MQLALYRTLLWLGTPLLWLWLYIRKLQGKEAPLRAHERWGKSSFPRPSGPLIWVHAASVGESNAILPVIEKIVELHTDITVLLTTGTVTSAGLMENKLPERAYHQFVPVDHPIAVKRFLKHWRPNLSLFVESELWPNLVLGARSMGSPVVVVNGRISTESVKHWQRFGNLARTVFGCLNLVMAQSKQDTDHYRMLGAGTVAYSGNLKYDGTPLPADSKAMGGMVSMIGERPIWLAASTHPGEEVLLGEAHKILKEKEQFADLITIIVPRHATRGKDISTELEALGLKVARRSKDAPILPETDVYLSDTMGELGLFYRLATIVFIGGSLVPKGGQNPLEPARLHCAIIVGPHMTNFLEMTEEFIEKNACIIVQDSASLAIALEEMLSDHEKQEEYAEAADQLVKNKKGVLESTLEALEPYIIEAQKRGA